MNQASEPKQAAVSDEIAQAIKLKAVQLATGNIDLELLEYLDEYILDPRIKTPEDVAKDELRMSLDEREAAILLPFVDLHGYGCVLIQRYNSVITPYGLVERRDGCPLVARENRDE